MNILIVANHYAVCSARYAADAFTRLGHTLRHVGTPMGRNIWGGQVPEEYVWTPDFPAMEYHWETENFTPDIVVVMDSDANLLDALGAADWDCPVIVWGVDNHVRDYRRPYFDHYFLAHKSVSVMAWHHDLDTLMLGGINRHAKDYPHISPDRAENEDMTWLPVGYDPVAFPPSPIPWNERKYDVCMVGVMYPKRWELVQAMRQVGLKVFAGTGLIYDAYREAYHNSRVALVSSACGDLPIRLFEGAGMGCAVLFDNINDLHLVDPYHPHFHYSSVEMAVERTQQLQSLSHSGENAQSWASDHTFDKRAQVIIDWMEAR